MEAALVMFTADGQRKTFPLQRNVTVIGRREDCDLRIPLGEVSRKHCRLIKEGEALRLEDLGSSNGSYHNRVRVQEGIVQGGDVVQVGPVIFIVQIDGVPADDDIQPPAAAVTQSPADIADSVAGKNGTQAVGDAVAEFDPSALLEDPPGGPPSLPQGR